MYNNTKNYKKLKEIYYASAQVTSAISHPRVVGVIKECGGKMWMRESMSQRVLHDIMTNTRSRAMGTSIRRLLHFFPQL